MPLQTAEWNVADPTFERVFAMHLPSAAMRRRSARATAEEQWEKFIALSTRERLSRIWQILGVLAVLPLALGVYVGLRVLNWFRPVRIGTLNAKGRLSVMVSYIEPYLRSLEMQGVRNALVIVINPGACPNEQLTRMYKRAVWLLDDAQPWIRHLFSTSHWFFASRSKIAAPLRVGITRGFARIWQEGHPALRFTADEQLEGRRLLERLGIPSGAPYVGLGLRDAAYYQQFLTPEAQARARHLNVEAGPDTYIRNPSLSHYLFMISQCATTGLYVLRMGQVASHPLPPGLPGRVIDYASRHRTPFGDIFLLATCKFLIAGGSPGLWLVSSAFNRPVVWTDSYCLQVRGLRSGDLFIPNLLWVVGEKRFLTFREMLASFTRYSFESRCRADGIEVVHNTPEEIAAVVEEMNQRVDGTWQAGEEDEVLQSRFNGLYTPEHIGYGLPGRMGTAFLRQHVDLLDEKL